MLAGLEAKEEVTGVFGVGTEGIGRATGVGLGVGLEPLIWKKTLESRKPIYDLSNIPVSALLLPLRNFS